MRVCVCIFIMWVGSTLIVSGQTDTARQQPEPPVPLEQQGREHLTEEQGYSKEDRVEVEKSNLPTLLQKKLENDEQYRGWEEGTIYLEKNTNQYLLHITQGETTRTYRFDEFGNALEDTVPADQPRER